ISAYSHVTCTTHGDCSHIPGRQRGLFSTQVTSGRRPANFRADGAPRSTAQGEKSWHEITMTGTTAISGTAPGMKYAHGSVMKRQSAGASWMKRTKAAMPTGTTART